MNTWIISDTHWKHAKIIEYEHRPSNYNELMIKNWNTLVAWDDLVIHCGDLVFGNHPEVLAQLNGNIVLVRGNHDRQSMSWYLSNNIKFVCDSFSLKAYGKLIIFTHAPMVTIPVEYDMNIHGHLHRFTHRSLEDYADYLTDERYSLVSMELENYSPVLLEEFVNRKQRRLPDDKE